MQQEGFIVAARFITSAASFLFASLADVFDAGILQFFESSIGRVITSFCFSVF
jgi:hypothetical protein